MSIYFKTNGGDTYVSFNKETMTSEVIVKSELEKQIEEAKKRLAEIPTIPSDEELLTWAKQNYPIMDYSAEKSSLEKIIGEGEAILANLK